MAQQLNALRTPAAYEGVSRYARSHTGEAAAAAYLALGHAYLEDKRYSEAEESLRLARQAGAELADYADYFAAQAHLESGDQRGAEALLKGFTARYPDSIFVDDTPQMEATALLGLGQPAAAERVLAEGAGGQTADKPGLELTQAEVDGALGLTDEAVRGYKHVLLDHPLTEEARTARAKLAAMGAEQSLTLPELRMLAEAYYKGGHYSEASEQYHALAHAAGVDVAERNAFAVAAAACDLKLKTLRASEVEALPDTQDESGARRLYLLMELARSHEDLDGQRRAVAEMINRFPQSRWLAEALYSSGNMYLLRKEFPAAVEYYSYLAEHFPANAEAPAAHWKAAWLTYRQGLYADAAKMFDEQIRLYPAAKETVSAIYWRSRIYETQDRRGDLAVAGYKTVVRAYQHYFYAQLARQRLAALGDLPAAAEPILERFQPEPVPVLDDGVPEESPHLAKAKVVANAGLNEYIAAEIAADPDSGSWSALAEAEIYSSYGETYRAVRALKRALPYAATASIKAIPLSYWRILFPQPWWDTIVEESAKYNLDPYLVASLIRQESEFNPNAISPANAYGLMQLLPSVGRTMARQEGMAHFQTFQLLDPITNIRLGTRYLRQTLDKFGGEPVYALAAYDAGDDRVADWQASGPYSGLDEFVESIPFTETREYVQAILRNEETYKSIDAFAAAHRSARPVGAE